MGIVIRWLGPFVLLAATFNPTEWNFDRWSQANWQDQMPLTVLFGLILGVGYMNRVFHDITSNPPGTIELE